MLIARALIKATTEGAPPQECSWAILGSMIAEEQYVERLTPASLREPSSIQTKIW